MTNVIPPPASIMKARCEEIGNMTVCLYYLSCQAQAAGLSDVAEIIRQSITSVVALGVKTYQEHLREVLTKNTNDEVVFIENFCHVNDEAVRFGIQDILYQKPPQKEREG